MSQSQFKARCTRSHRPQVLLVGETGRHPRGERYFALDPEEAVRLAGDLLEAAQQARRLTSDAPGRQPSPPPQATLPISVRPEACRHVPDSCPLPVCLCRPYPISAERVQELCDLRKLVAPFGFRNFWISSVSDSQEEIPRADDTPPQATPEVALPVVDQ